MTNSSYYKSAIKITALFGAAIFFPLLIVYILATGGHFPEWLLDALGLLLPLCKQVSANGYVAKFFDFINNFTKGSKNKKDKKLINAENIGLTIGLVTALVFSITSIAFFHLLP